MIFNKKFPIIILIFTLLISGPSFIYSQQKQVRAWTDIRDNEIVKQKWDYSCGIASLATILNFKYKTKFNEDEMIEAFAKLKGVSLEDLKKQETYTLLDIKKLSEHLGYSSVGYALDFETLKKLPLPLLVYIIPNSGNNHFSVLKKIDNQFVYLADPSWGNTKIKHSKFIGIFKTDPDSSRYGKVLVISKN